MPANGQIESDFPCAELHDSSGLGLEGGKQTEKEVKLKEMLSKESRLWLVVVAHHASRMWTSAW